MPQQVRDRIPEIKNMKTYSDFVNYFAEKGIALDTDLNILKFEKANEEIEPVYTLGQKLVTAVETYKAEYGENALNKLNKILFYSEEETSTAAYYFNVVGENDKDAGTIKFKDWNANGRTVFHELVHAFQDSCALPGQDALMFSDQLANAINIDKYPSPRTTWNDETYNAEKIADIFGYGFYNGKKQNEEFMKDVFDYLK